MNTAVSVASLASSTAIAAPSIGPDHPDAELLRLDAKLDRVERDWFAQKALDQKHSRAYEAACDAVGLPRKRLNDFEGEDIDEKRKQFLAHHEKRQAVEYEGKEEDNADPELKRWDRIHDRMWPLVDAILAVKPQSLEGLAVITRAVALANAEWWDGDEHGGEAAAYIESVAFFLGIKPAPLRLSDEQHHITRTIMDAPASVPAAEFEQASDPIFAAIEAHKRAWINLEPCSDLEYAASHRGDKAAERELAQLQAALDGATEKLLDPPTTIAGFAAVLAYAADHVSGNAGAQWPNGEAWISRHGVEWEVILHRNLGKALQAMAMPAAVSLPTPKQAADPIFAAIDAHQKATMQYNCALRAVDLYQDSHRQGDGSFPDRKKHPELKKLERRLQKAVDAHHDAACEMVLTVPITAAGVQALVRAVQSDIDVLGLYLVQDPDKDCEEAFYQTLQTALERLAA